MAATLLFIAGCEEGVSSSRGGNHQKAKASAPSGPKPRSNNSGTASAKMIIPDPDMFLTSPLTDPPIRTGRTSSPDIGVGQVSEGTGNVNTPVAKNNPPSALPNDNALPNAVATPEPLTAMLGLMGLGAIGMATRRRAA